MNEVIALLIGLTIFLMAVEVVNFASRRRKYSRRASWDDTAGKELALRSARVEDDLRPLIERLELKDSEITIVDDAKDDEECVRTRHLKEAAAYWTQRGAKVQYLLIQGDTISTTEYLRSGFFRRLVGRPNVRSTRCRIEGDLDAAETLLLTRHPVLVDTVSGHAFWEETSRGKSGSPALNVRWVPPSAMTEKDSEVYNRYQKIIESVRGRCKLGTS